MEINEVQTHIESAYEQAGKDLVFAVKPIADYYWNLPYRDRKAVISPKIENDGSTRSLVLVGDDFPGWISTNERRSAFTGIAVAKYTGLPANTKLKNIVKIEEVRNGEGVDTNFLKIPDLLLLLPVVSVNLPHNKKYSNRSTVGVIGAIEYNKNDLINIATELSGPLSINSVFGSHWGEEEDSWGDPIGSKQRNFWRVMMGADNTKYDISNINAPVIIYEPGDGVINPFNTKKFFPPGFLPKTVTWNTTEILRIKNEWLDQFSSGINTVKQSDKLVI